MKTNEYKIKFKLEDGQKYVYWFAARTAFAATRMAKSELPAFRSGVKSYSCKKVNANTNE